MLAKHSPGAYAASKSAGYKRPRNPHIEEEEEDNSGSGSIIGSTYSASDAESGSFQDTAPGSPALWDALAALDVTGTVDGAIYQQNNTSGHSRSSSLLSSLSPLPDMTSPQVTELVPVPPWLLDSSESISAAQTHSSTSNINGDIPSPIFDSPRSHSPANSPRFSNSVPDAEEPEDDEGITYRIGYVVTEDSKVKKDRVPYNHPQREHTDDLTLISSSVNQEEPIPPIIYTSELGFASDSNSGWYSDSYSEPETESHTNGAVASPTSKTSRRKRKLKRSRSQFSLHDERQDYKTRKLDSNDSSD